MARGAAKLFGVELMSNFKQPYLSNNITNFWNTWHISLSQWLKNYIYIPLGGNRRGKIQTYKNLFLTMLIGGLWHGASLNFLIWGGLHGLYLIIHKAYLKLKRPTLLIYFFNFIHSDLRNIFNILLSFTLVTFTWLFFRSISLEDTHLFLSKIIHWENSENFLILSPILITYLIMIVSLDTYERKHNSEEFILKIPNQGIQAGILTGIFIITILYMYQCEPLPFIYFQF
jgi:alginate O-acetyltransferase complex protein AlgI